MSRFGLTAESVAIENGQARSEASIDDASRHDAALFAIWSRPISEAMTVEVGLRGDRLKSRNEGGFFGDVSIERSAASGHAALTWRASERLTGSIQAARGFREPTLSDRFFRGTTARGLITGNPELEPETSLQLDGSLRWTGSSSRAALFVYDYEIDDLVERYRAAGDYRFRNRGTARLRGIELEASAPLGENVELQLAAAAARGEAGGDPLDEVAPPNAQATIRWSGETGFAFVRVHAVTREERPGPLEVERPGSMTADASVGWRVRPTIEIIAAVENLASTARVSRLPTRARHSRRGGRGRSRLSGDGRDRLRPRTTGEDPYPSPRRTWPRCGIFIAGRGEGVRGGAVRNSRRSEVEPVCAPHPCPSPRNTVFARTPLSAGRGVLPAQPVPTCSPGAGTRTGRHATFRFGRHRRRNRPPAPRSRILCLWISPS